MRVFHFVFPVSVYLLVFCGCNDTRTQNKAEFANHKSEDTVRKDITKDGNGNNTYYSLVKEFENSLHLGSLEGGFDSLAIRIWHYAPFSKQGELFVLEDQNSKLSAHIALLTYFFSDTAYRIKVDSILKRSEFVTTKSDLKDILNKIVSLRVLDLPDGSVVAKGCSVSDGDRYFIEIGTKYLYRFYSYQSPGICKDKIKEADNIFKIVTLIEHEFGVSFASSK